MVMQSANNGLGSIYVSGFTAGMRIKQFTMCPFDAIAPIWGQANDVLNEKIAEYAYAVVKDRPNFHIALAIDISPECDCGNYNAIPSVADVGMFASFDPVALDQACADACNRMPVMAGSQLSDNLAKCESHHDHFKDTAPATDWTYTLIHAEALGIGTRKYELVTVK